MSDWGKNSPGLRLNGPAFLAIVVLALTAVTFPDFWKRYDPDHGMDLGLGLLVTLLSGAITFAAASLALRLWRWTRKDRATPIDGSSTGERSGWR